MVLNSAAAVTATVAAAPTVVPTTTVITAGTAAIPNADTAGRATATEEDNEDQNDPQTAITAPATIVTTHKSEPPNQSWRPLSDLSSSYAAAAGVCVTETDFPEW